MSNKGRARAGARRRKRKTLLLRPAKIKQTGKIDFWNSLPAGPNDGDGDISIEMMPEVVRWDVAFYAISDILAGRLMRIGMKWVRVA
jgi:hypothetical protein